MRIRWIDGLKGIASLMIFLHHFILAFIPAFYYGSSVDSRMFMNEGSLADSPFLFFINGHFLVNLFLLLSGLVLSLRVEKISSLKEVIRKIYVRYLRLAIPVLVISLIVYLLSKFNFFYNFELAMLTGSPWLTLYYNSPKTLSSAFETSLFSVWFVGNDLFSTAFWMLEHLFYGSLLVYVIGFMLRKQNERFKLWIIILIISTTIIFDSYLVNFGFGMLIAWMYAHSSHKKLDKNYAWVLVILGCLLAGYPQGVQPTNIYTWLNPIHDYFGSNILIHSFASFLIVLGLLNLNSELRIFNTKFAQSIGQLYFPIYLIHIPLIFSFSSYAFIILNQLNISYQANVIMTFLLSTGVLLILANLFKRTVLDKIYELK